MVVDVEGCTREAMVDTMAREVVHLMTGKVEKATMKKGEMVDAMEKV